MMLPFPDKKFQIIYADPPWQYDLKDFGKGTAIGERYQTMTIAEIQQIPIPIISDDNCVLFLWATSPLLPEALEVMTSWKFNFKTIAFCWVKTTKDGVAPKTNLGKWTLGSIELCLLGVKGKPKRQRTDIRQIITTPVGLHSAKPEEVKNRIKQLMGNVPGIELFARNSDADWEVWGNETTKNNPAKGFFV